MLQIGLRQAGYQLDIYYWRSGLDEWNTLLFQNVCAAVLRAGAHERCPNQRAEIQRVVGFYYSQALTALPVVDRFVTIRYTKLGNAIPSIMCNSSWCFENTTAVYSVNQLVACHLLYACVFDYLSQVVFY